VYADDRYVAVRVSLTAAGIGVDCGDWPPSGVKCETCGRGD